MVARRERAWAGWGLVMGCPGSSRRDHIRSCMSHFIQEELEYLQSDLFGRLATIGADGPPHIPPAIHPGATSLMVNLTTLRELPGRAGGTAPRRPTSWPPSGIGGMRSGGQPIRSWSPSVRTTTGCSSPGLTPYSPAYPRNSSALRGSSRASRPGHSVSAQPKSFGTYCNCSVLSG